MQKTLSSWLMITIILLIAGCQYSGGEPAAKTSTDPVDYRQRGAAIGQKLTGTLMSHLARQIETHGPAGAVEYCSLQALPLTDSIARAEKVQIKRVSHRPRNPQNAANERELALIEKYREEMADGQALEPHLRKTENEVQFYAPIVLSMPTCLKCHGQPGADIDSATRQVLQQRYPEDRATGFSLGEIRGLLVVNFPET